MAKHSPEQTRGSSEEEVPDIDAIDVDQARPRRLKSEARGWRLAGIHLLIHAAGALCGYGAFKLGVPLPWMIGSMLFAAFCALGLKAPQPPRFTRATGQVAVGGGVGLYLSPEALARIVESLPPMMLSWILIVLVSLIISLVQVRLTGTSMSTVFFATVPGGPADMANLAERHGGDSGQVALAQAMRIVAIVMLFPPLLLLGGYQFEAAAPVAGVMPGQGLVLSLAVMTIGGVIAAWLRILNPFFLGPMILAGVLTVSGVEMSRLPDALIAAAQVLLGVSVGMMFRRRLFRSFAITGTIVVSTIVLLVVSLGIAYLLHVLFGLHLATMALANAPGSVTEMALTAKAMHLDVSLVAAFHLARIFFILLLVPYLFDGMRRWAARKR